MKRDNFMIYEYKIATIETAGSWFGGDVDKKTMLKKINILAKDGWELSSVAPITEGSIMKVFGSIMNLLLFFKRPEK